MGQVHQISTSTNSIFLVRMLEVQAEMVTIKYSQSRRKKNKSHNKMKKWIIRSPMLVDRMILRTTANSQLKRITTCNSGAMFKLSLTNLMGTTIISTSIGSHQIMRIMVALEQITSMNSITTMITRVTTTVRLSRTINRMIMAVGERIRTMVEGMAEINMTSARAKAISQIRITAEEIHIRQATNSTSVVLHHNLEIR